MYSWFLNDIILIITIVLFSCIKGKLFIEKKSADRYLRFYIHIYILKQFCNVRL